MDQVYIRRHSTALFDNAMSLAPLPTAGPLEGWLRRPLAGLQHQGYSATKRAAVSLACLSQASIFTVWPLDNVSSVTAYLLISTSQNPLIQAECEGSLKKRLALLPSSLVPHSPGFALSTSRPTPIMNFFPLSSLCAGPSKCAV
jgi:hypothetical protein